MKSLLLMISFFTRIPISYSHEYNNKDFIKGIKLMPIIGFIIGIFLYLPSLLGQYIHRPILILIIWTIYLIITGGLHIDGLADTADGIFSYRKKEEVLEIMRDSRVGVFGAISVFWILLCNIVLSYYIKNNIFILIPIVGRISAIVAGSLSKYAREESGMGSPFIDNCTKKEVLIGILFCMVVVIIIGSNYIFIPFSLTLMSVMIITKNIEKTIGGMTGDTIGAIIEISQTLFMFFIIIQESVKLLTIT